MSTIDATHDPALRCWVPGADGHPEFPIQNLPFGVFSPPAASARSGVAIGSSILDLTALAATMNRPPFDAVVAPKFRNRCGGRFVA